jgi:predicted MFS family arabinose efflux permease
LQPCAAVARYCGAELIDGSGRWQTWTTRLKKAASLPVRGFFYSRQESAMKMHDRAAHAAAAAASPAATRRAAALSAFACALTLSVALGVGRFAFTPLLPLMLQEGRLTINAGSWLASLNYAGYFVGALSCAFLPFDHRKLLRFGLVMTTALTLLMGLTHGFAIWGLLRLIAGIVSAWTFVFASQWGLRRLAELHQPGWGGVIYTGPGLGILVTGLLVSVAGSWGSRVGWLGFGALALMLSALVWKMFAAPPHEANPPPVPAMPREPATASVTVGAGAASRRTHTPVSPGGAEFDAPEPGVRAMLISAPFGGAASSSLSTNAAGVPPASAARTRALKRDAAWLVFLYGLPGFGYIITATFLPVIARAALPGSVWPDRFWPMFGLAIVLGAVSASRTPQHWDNRLLLAISYLMQAAGIVLGVVWPSVPGFAIGSMLIGLPFTAITLFAMREARRIRHNQAAGLMGYATASYGAGQIAGPLIAAPLATATGSFSLALLLAALVLAAGAAMLLMVWRHARNQVVGPRRLP